MRIELFTEISKLQKLSNLIDDEVKRNFYNANFSRIAIRYVEECSFQFKPFLFLSMISCLRFSDILHFKLHEFASTQIFFINQKKTNRPVKLDFSFVSPQLCKALSELNEFSLWLNYHEVSREFFRLHLRLNRNARFNFSSLTHFFRHLHSSFLAASNTPKTVIKTVLGHSELETQKYYTHNLELFEQS